MVTRPLNTLLTLRQILSDHVAGVDPAIVDQIPTGCNNNLRWQLGHVIGSTERHCLVLTGLGTLGLTPGWTDWFGIRTAPADFTAATPDWPGLLAALADSTARIQAAVEGQDLDVPLAEPFAPRGTIVFASTRAEAVAFALWHEGLHYGQIMTYCNVLKA